MLKSINSFKGAITFLLTFVVKFAVVLSVIYVFQSLFDLLFTYPLHIVQTDELRTLFGAILFVVLALELNHLLTQYSVNDKIEINTVLAVLIIAFARNLLLLNLAESDILLLAGGSLVLLAAGVTYWLISKTDSEIEEKNISRTSSPEPHGNGCAAETYEQRLV